MHAISLRTNGYSAYIVQRCVLIVVQKRSGGSFCAGCIFADFDAIAIVAIREGAQVAFQDCTFTGNTLTNTTDPPSAVINVVTTAAQPGVRVEGCTFSNNTPSMHPNVFVTLNGAAALGDKAVVFSDSSLSVCTIRMLSFAPTTEGCVTSSPLELEVAGDGFLNASNAWFVQVQEVRPWCDT